jgi:hypothetical protein
MSKLPVAIIAALVAVATMYSSTAEAGLRIGFGFGGGLPFAHGGGGYSQQHHHRKRYIARRVKKEKAYVAKRKVSEPKVAKVEKVKPEVVATAPVVEPDVIADSENSSITTAALDSTAAVDPETVTPVKVKTESKTAAAKPAVSKPEKAAKLDCKKFFPSVGMTLSVPCE